MPVPIRARRKRSLLGRLVRESIALVVAFYVVVACSLILLRWVPPASTVVQIERRIEAMMQHRAYSKSYTFVPLSEISVHLRHAVVAAEDARFYQHHGFDWNQVQIAVKDDLERGKTRGASTITQQLVKNLYLGTSRSFIRKGIEFTIVPLAEGLLSKQRILELYLNVIEWGPGIYGAQAAAERYYNIPASKVTREQSIGLAEILPAPLRRKPGRLPEYGAAIEERMAQMKW
jgi:monofunctional biosynthetic peptidoglycan transglycosylase